MELPLDAVWTKWFDSDPRAASERADAAEAKRERMDQAQLNAEGIEVAEIKPGALAKAHAAALEKAASAAEQWRRSARSLRLVKGKRIARKNWAVGARIGYQTFAHARRSRSALAGFLILFVIPAIFSILYFSLIVSSEFTSEARFAVRGGERVSTDAISALTGLASFTQVQDSMIVANYVRSQAIVEALEKEIDLRAIYSKHSIDWLSRFNADKPIEAFVKYWLRRVKTSIESPSGIITVKISAFSPEDALKVADATVDLSERLVNGLSTRALNDAVTQAERELARAESRLSAARVALRDLRNSQATLDPRRTAEGIGKLVAELRLEKIHLEQDVAAAERGNIEASAPQVQIMRARLEVIGEQIASLEERVTSQDGAQTEALSGKITRFDELELERQIAEKQYTQAAAALERARVNAEGKRVYLATFVRPVLAYEPSYPHRFLFSLLGVGAAALLYVGGMAVFRAMRRKLAG
jgi:capsular polysaccharide transport system permease protein